MLDAYLANVPTPLMFGGFLALTVGNFLIGMLEAWVLERRSLPPTTRPPPSVMCSRHGFSDCGKALWIAWA